ncbi:flavin reductase family protein [Sphingomonas sp.]|uniref:flavin reductase family protein n=1 Tax=Sphingomonas sp. TaxID=28214 RepID=UPI003B007B97
MNSNSTPDVDGATFRRVLGHYPTGVCVITAIDPGGDPVGLAIGSFSSVSLEPPLVAFFPDRRSTSWPRIQAAGKFCANVLASDQEAVCRRFASKGGDKFADISHRVSANGSPILDGVVAWIDCDLHAVHEAGDHDIALGRVKELEVESKAGPLLFFQGGYGEFAMLA